MSADAQPARPATKTKREDAAPKQTTSLPRGALALAVASERPQIGPRKLFICTYNAPWNDIFDPGSGVRKFWFKGGRASFKSTFISEAIALGMEADGQKALQEKKRGNPAWKKFLTHAVVYRKYGVDIHDSVFTQFKVTVTDILGHGALWHFAKTGRRAIYLPTGQQIVFRGLDDAQKQKSIKAPFGFFKYLWFEEATEYAGMKELRSVEQSVQRGGHRFLTFVSYNPPRSRQDWVNEAAALPSEGRSVYHSTFLDAAKYAPEWLGPDFFRDARALLELDDEAFRHEYLGEITGTGAEVFKRLKSRTITQEDLSNCGVRRFGLDFGFEGDPSALISCAYDAKRRILYIYREWVKKGQFEEQIADAIKAQGLRKKVIYADSSEPRSIARLQMLGCHGVQKCDKSPSTNSVEDGLHWLQGLRAIVIDPHTCPVATREFSRYEYKKDKDGNSTGLFLDRDNHTIDAVRYAMQTEIRYGDNMAKWNRV